ncbi:MAG: hypothetical protein NPINA01_10930 [Nitrospinaceae bacterium]|nr:MAG: hypothetical protein NPINA01_10930 [Nitrospinaceae bacterium]
MIGKFLPKSLKKEIKKTKLWKLNNARSLSGNAKRLDLCAAQMAHVLHLANFPGKPVAEKNCLEMGSGWVLTHALVLHLLGAQKVIATDVENNASPQFIKRSIEKSIPSVVRDILSPFEDHGRLRERLNRLLAIDQFSFDVLKGLGIEYIAPVDMTKFQYENKIDAVFSFSVLEHVPAKDIDPIFDNLLKITSGHGFMIHSIHLEDHADFQFHPLRFLTVPNEKYDEHCETERGNRIRASQWKDLIQKLENSNSKVLYEFQRDAELLPKTIDPSIKYTDENDLRTSHLGVLVEKNLRE